MDTDDDEEEEEEGEEEEEEEQEQEDEEEDDGGGRGERENVGRVARLVWGSKRSDYDGTAIVGIRATKGPLLWESELQRDRYCGKQRYKGTAIVGHRDIKGPLLWDTEIHKDRYCGAQRDTRTACVGRWPRGVAGRHGVVFVTLPMRNHNFWTLRCL